MRSTHYARHETACEPCRTGHPCRTGRTLLGTRWTRTVPAVPVSKAGTTAINVRALVLGAGQ
jgi:hypothetical protein